MTDLDALLRCACDAARAAGDAVSPWLGRAVPMRATTPGPVTKADLDAEQAALAVIRRAFPAHAVLSEEQGLTGTDPRRWILDPLDGTANFVRGIPWYDVSVAFETGGRVEVGVVYAPALGWLFTAVRGRGAWLNGRPIAVSTHGTLEGGVVDVGFRRQDWTDPSRLACLARLSQAGVELRSLNACALDLAFVAAGWLEAYWDVWAHPWDVAAGKVLVREAGGRVTERPLAQAPDAPMVIVGSNAGLHDAVCTAVELT
ncbi:MAG: inositol monophosphatase family protein [Armatimonadota bacterium]|nr:inositol monophosphatase family protein [Armatimonadota bacterium]